ncbi:MAG: chemotaxis protein CheX [Candidatus Sulfotelmatobacter sp.]
MKSVREMLATNGSHENWIPLLEVATREVFELMLSCQLAVPTSTEEPSLDVTAMVGLAGQLCGVLSVRCEGKAAALMASRMLGVALEKVGSDVSDAIGEVCNMVAGNFKNKIAGLAEGCMLSPPTVITGSDYVLHSQVDSPTIAVSLLFESLLIVISLQIHS